MKTPPSPSSEQSHPERRVVFSMRLIVTVATAALVITAVLAVGRVAETNVREVLTREVQTRLVLEARSLASVGSNALLSDFPELTLHPVIKEMEMQRPDLAVVYVVDHNNIIQGHGDAHRLGTPLDLDLDLDPVPSDVALGNGEVLVGNDDVIIVQTPITHPNGEIIGRAIVGVDRGHIDALMLAARKPQGIVFLIILITALLVTPVLISILLRPIGTLRKGLEQIGLGKLDTRLDVSSRTELGLLADSINRMAEELGAAQSELVEKERLDHEMQLAKRIQESLLPSEITFVDDFTISGAQTVAEVVGGDYYDVFALNDGRIGLVIADVAGKGLGGCLVTSMLAVLLRTLCPKHTSPRELMIALQGSLIDSLQPGVFVTMFYGMLDPGTGYMTYSSAGHNPMLHFVSATGHTQWHQTKGIPVGLIPGAALAESLEDKALELAPGDVLIQYTDGFSEATNPSGEEFGLARIEECAKELAPRGCDAVVEGLQHAVSRWEKSATAADDKTLLVVSRSEDTKDTMPDSLAGGLPHHNRIRELWQRRSAAGFHTSFPAVLDRLDDIGAWLRACGHLGDLPPHQLGALEQGIYELCANIAEHGCNLDASKVIDLWWIPGDLAGGGPNSPMDATLEVSGGHFLIRDHGTPPNAQNWELPSLDSTKVRREGRGLGLRIINKIFDDVAFYPSTAHGNLTVMTFKTSQHQPIREV